MTNAAQQALQLDYPNTQIVQKSQKEDNHTFVKPRSYRGAPAGRRGIRGARNYRNTNLRFPQNRSQMRGAIPHNSYRQNNHTHLVRGNYRNAWNTPSQLPKLSTSDLNLTLASIQRQLQQAIHQMQGSSQSDDRRPNPPSQQVSSVPQSATEDSIQNTDNDDDSVPNSMDIEFSNPIPVDQGDEKLEDWGSKDDGQWETEPKKIE